MSAPVHQKTAMDLRLQRPRVALLRGFWLNNFEMQNYAPLQEMGFDLHAYTTADHLFETDLIQMPVTVLPTPRRVLSRVPGLRRVIQKGLRARGEHEYWMADVERLAQNADLLHAAETYNGFSWQAARVAQRADKPLVLTVWENIPFLRDEDPASRRIKEEVKAVACRYLAITERARTALRVEGIPDAQIRVIGCGIDRTHFAPGPKDPVLLARFGLKPDDFVVLCACQLLPLKGLYELLSALALLRKDPALKARLRVLVVGEGAGRAALEERRAWMGLDDVFLLPGKVSYADMPRIHNLADVFVLPSVPTPTWQEQFGMVLAESMACGKPVVSTLSGSIPDVVGEAGLLVQPADPTALADALSRIAWDGSLRENLAERAFARAREAFDARSVAARIGACYQELL